MVHSFGLGTAARTSAHTHYVMNNEKCKKKKIITIHLLNTNTEKLNIIETDK